jgi:putative NADH-flavin reductase
MHIAIFGANGATGRLLTERSLAAGHTVSALLRTPEDFPFKDRVRIVKGSAFDPAAIAETLAGTDLRADLILSALGAKSPIRNENVLPRAIPLIVAAMESQGPKRIIALGSAGALPTSLDKQPAYRRWIVENIVYKVFLKYPVAEQVSQYRNLSASSLDWTMVMPPMLSNAAAKGRYRIDGDALPRNGSMISRADVADFMMLQIGNPQWLRKGVYITW